MPTPLDFAASIQTMSSIELDQNSAQIRSMLLDTGNAILESWIVAHDERPTQDTHEGFRLLGLHRQAARNDPSFNACRESCRELIYQCNVAKIEENPENAARHLRLAASVLSHLALFIDGKLENARLGEFCCSARPIRSRDAAFELAYDTNHQQGDTS